MHLDSSSFVGSLGISERESCAAWSPSQVEPALVDVVCKISREKRLETVTHTYKHMFD